MDLNYIKEKAATCTWCELHKGRVIPVFSKGNINAKLMLVGMCPGPDENNIRNADKLPFVGRAGQLLDVMLEEVGLTIDLVYITNIVKCFVQPGTKLKESWYSNCLSYFISELSFVKNSTMLLLGKDVAVALLGINSSKTFDELRKHNYSYFGINVIPTYHPSYFERKGGVNHRDYKKGIEDFKKAVYLAKL